MPFTTYSDGTIIFAAQLNADNAATLDINTSSPQTVQSTVSFAGLSTTPMTVNGLLTLKGALVDNVKIVSSGAAYAVLQSDRYVMCQSNAALSVGLPSSPAIGRVITIKDAGGTAGTGVITITPASGQIDGQSSYVISAAWGKVTLIHNGVRWLST